MRFPFLTSAKRLLVLLSLPAIGAGCGGGDDTGAGGSGGGGTHSSTGSSTTTSSTGGMGGTGTGGTGTGGTGTSSFVMAPHPPFPTMQGDPIYVIANPR